MPMMTRRALGHNYGAGRQPGRVVVHGHSEPITLPDGSNSHLPMVRPVSAPQDFRTAPPYVITSPPQVAPPSRRGVPGAGAVALTPAAQRIPVDLTDPRTFRGAGR